VEKEKEHSADGHASVSGSLEDVDSDAFANESEDATAETEHCFPNVSRWD
jgi:hypothetical protein